MTTTGENTQARSTRFGFLLRLVREMVTKLSATRISLERRVVATLSGAIGSVKHFVGKYPAVLSGYIIYSYLFITIMRFFLKAKSRELTLYEIYETFDALPFMWLLASALVRIIDTKTRLHNSEKNRILSLRELEIKQTQLKTMHEVARGFQHKINNPLTIISLTLTGTRRAAAGNTAVLDGLGVIKSSAARIKQAVLDFSGADRYEVECAGQVVGSMASPPSTDAPA